MRACVPGCSGEGRGDAAVPARIRHVQARGETFWLGYSKTVIKYVKTCLTEGPRVELRLPLPLLPTWHP